MKKISDSPSYLPYDIFYPGSNADFINQLKRHLYLKLIQYGILTRHADFLHMKRLPTINFNCMTAAGYSTACASSERMI